MQLDGERSAKSDRLVPGSVLDVAFPREDDPLEVVAELVDGHHVIHDDDATSWWSTSRSASPCTPSMGWTGPTVVGHLRAAGFRIATSGAPERQGIVQRLDVGTRA